MRTGPHRVERQAYIHICRLICMSSRNVAVRKDVYDALVREKRPQESFTRLFHRLLNQRGPLEDLAGAWGKPTDPREARWISLWRGLVTHHARGRR
jgi:predicted CopG family antitoxin